MAESAIELKDVTVTYRTQRAPSLHDVSLRIGWGEKVAIIGASGSGKSTIGHLINGLIPHRHRARVEGTVRVAGGDPVSDPLTRTASSVGTVLQDSDAQFVALTVAEDIAFSLENQQTPTGQMPHLVAQVAEQVAVEQLLEHSPHDLSGGQKQRVAVGGVLVDDVPILLFDEPLANLDPATGLATIELIDRLHRSGRTVVIIEHRLEEVLRCHVDRIVVLDRGRVVADAPPDEVVTGGLLSDLGIRPPLHLLALERAGVEVTPEQRPARVTTIALAPSELQQLRQWQEGLSSGPVVEQEGEVAVELHGVSCRYGQTRDHEGRLALDGVDLRVRTGELVAVLGTNGAGKSTLAKAIAGFLRPTSGRITLLGRDTAEDSIAEIGRRVGYVLQDPNQMISRAMIADEVALGPLARGLPQAEVDDLVADALRTCGLHPYRSWPIAALSHGQRKRVTIAAGLVMRPSVLILDEPTAGQDFRHYTEFMEFIREVNEAGTTVLLVTHSMHLALEYTHRAVVLHDGRIIADDTPARVLADDTVTTRANLVRPGLYELAERIGLDREGQGEFVARFIVEDRRRRSGDG